MDRFAIITNRKRAIIALMHSVFFLGVAGMQLAISHAEAFSIHREKMTGSIILLIIYVIVTTVLLVLFSLLALHQGKALLRALRGQCSFRAGTYSAWRSSATRQRAPRILSGRGCSDWDCHPARSLGRAGERQS